MSKVKIIWLPDANGDLRRLHNFLKEKDPGAARDAIAKIRDAVCIISDFPDIGIQLSLYFRQIYIPFGKGAYIVHYRKISENEIAITRVWHSRENRSKQRH